MSKFLIDESIAQAEQALLDALTYGLKTRKLTVASPAILRGIASISTGRTPTFIDDDLAYVTSKLNVYRWKQSSSAADDGDLVLAPDDAASSTGRWLKGVTAFKVDGVNAATLPSGIIKSVILHNGDFSEDVLKERIYGQAPCVAIHFSGEDHTPLSQIPGALYDYRVGFELWSVSQNFREKYEAAIGSPIPAEAAKDPGVMKIHGKVKKMIAGKPGTELGISSIKYVEIHKGRLEEANEKERRFVMALETVVLGSVDNPDAPAELSQPDEIGVQYERAQAPSAGAFDLDNCVTAGLDVPLATGFTVAIAAGSANIAGVAVASAGEAHTFTANTDTYRDLTPAGAWVFVEVANRAAPADPTAGNLRIGVTTTDATGIAADSFLCSVYRPYPAADSPDVVPL